MSALRMPFVEAVLPTGAVTVAHRSIGWDQHLEPALGDRFDLPRLPVTGVREDHLGPLAHTMALQVREGGVEHRLEVPEVAGRRR
jgi:hypothetical protein